jgi:hypothetical protein
LKPPYYVCQTEKEEKLEGKGEGGKNTDGEKNKLIGR